MRPKECAGVVREMREREREREGGREGGRERERERVRGYNNIQSTRLIPDSYCLLFNHLVTSK